ncbi:MAG: SWIM zinc finger family protein [Desulfurococcales archaeon]|nr:SWIM zinc finger family protein [Desulfurococcales archaeon]
MIGGNSQDVPPDIDDILSSESPSSETVRRARALVALRRLVRIWSDPPIYVSMSEHGDHVVVNGVFCSCEAFERSLRRGGGGCYHVWAARLYGSEAPRVNLSPEQAWSVIYEVATTGFSLTLRRILFGGGRG